MNAAFQYHEHFIEFTSLEVEHTDHHLMQKLFKILNIYNIKNKLFDVITDNTSNNDTLKKSLKKRSINVTFHEIKHKTQFLV